MASLCCIRKFFKVKGVDHWKELKKFRACGKLDTIHSYGSTVESESCVTLTYNHNMRCREAPRLLRIHALTLKSQIWNNFTYITENWNEHPDTLFSQALTSMYTIKKNLVTLVSAVSDWLPMTLTTWNIYAFAQQSLN